MEQHFSEVFKNFFFARRELILFMKVLSIGTDRNLFEEGSAVSLRQIKYGKLVEKLDIIVFALRKLNLSPKRYPLNVAIYPTNSLNRFLYFIDAFRIAMSLNKPDLVTAQDPFESGLAAFFASRYFGIPLNLQLHTDFLSPYFSKESLLNRLRILVAKFLIRRARSLRVVSERLKQSVIKANLKSDDAIKVLPIFVNVENIRGSVADVNLHKKYPQFDFIILMASRLTKEKNIGLAIDAMGEVVKNYPKTGLIIVGDGPESEKLKTKSEKLKIKNNIIWEGWSNDLASYYKTADLFLLTSNYEGYGMAIVEALSVGLPVVMSDVGCAGEVLIHERNGLIFAVGDLSGLVLSLNRFMSDLVLRGLIKSNIKATNFGLTEDKYFDEYKKNFA